MFRLSVEELAFAMGFLGGTEVAAGFLDTVFGKQNKDNLSGRITAASHSLIARGLLKLDLAANNNELDEELAQLVRTMMEAGHSVRAQRMFNGQEATLTCFVHDGVIAAHELALGVVAQLESLADQDTLLQRMIDFVQPPDGETAVSPPLGQISAETLQSVRQFASQKKADQIKSALADTLPEKLAAELAKDLQRGHITWGSILSLQTTSGDADTPLESNEGILYAAVTPQKLWLFQLKPDDPTQAHLFRGSRAQLRRLLQQQLQKSVGE